ncbi:protein kinase, partial [Planctomycetota bacterium]
MAKITVRVEGQSDQEYKIQDRLSVGRRNSNDIMLKDTLCSRDHAVIFESEGTYKVRDLGSHNGTFLNEEKISEQALNEGDIVRIGSTELHFSRKSADELLGERLGGYKILEILGVGGMGKVYKARQIAMDRVIALKVLSTKVTQDESFIAAFKQEAKVAGQLNHNNVVSVHDFGKTDDGIYYLSMEFIQGENIQELLDKKGKLTTEESVIIVSEVCKALKFAHTKSIIHSDIKPQNILLDRNGSVKVADLGLAKYFGKSSFDRKTDTVMGTPYYMSPEQATKSKVDARTDIYSLGATFFHMITGRPPFDGETPLTILTKHVTEEVISPRKYDITISTQISNLIKWMMEKNPEDRPADIGEIERELGVIKNQEQGKQAKVTARKGYVADIRKSMVNRRKKVKTKQTVSTAVSIIIAILLLAAAAVVLQKQIKKNSSGSGSGTGTSAGGNDVFIPSGVNNTNTTVNQTTNNQTTVSPVSSGKIEL